jgi:hypothetical protein
MTDPYYTPEELYSLTRKRTAPAQTRALRHMGIEHKMRPDGSIAVLRAHAEKEFGLGTGGGRIKKTGPNFEEMKA